MIIFGAYAIHRTLGEGHFACPQCLGTTSYRLRRGRRFIHIMFIPLIPIGRTPAFVECGTCRSKFALGVLPPAELLRHREALGDAFPPGVVPEGGGAPGFGDSGFGGAAPSGAGFGGAPGPGAPPVESQPPWGQAPGQHAPGPAPLAGLPLPGAPGVAPSPTPSPGPAPITAGAPLLHAAPSDRWASLGGEEVALARGVATGVLSRCETGTTLEGRQSALALVHRAGARDFTSDHLAHDLGNLDTSFVRDLVRGRVDAGRMLAEAARALIADAVVVARDNGDLTAGQWTWIVSLGLDAGVGPTLAGEIRDQVLTRR